MDLFDFAGLIFIILQGNFPVMSKRESLTRYTLIIKKLRKHPATFQEIADYLAYQSELEEYDFNISLRTFQRDIIDIRQVYKIDIQYHRSNRNYYINEDEQQEINERILEAFDTFNALNMADRLSDFIHFEKRKPVGTEHLNGVLHAMRNKRRLSFLYSSFKDEKDSERLIEPYALKEFKNRWYIVGKDLKDNKIKTFGLDRLTDLEITKQKFEAPPDFNVNDYYKNCFGIISPNASKPSKIEIWFTEKQGRYIKTLPLHETQRIIQDNEHGLIIELTLFLTYDLVMELLSFGGEMKVLKPIELIKQVKNAHLKGSSLYSKELTV